MSDSWPYGPETTGPPPEGLPLMGSDTPCNLDTCPIHWSIFEYRPSLPANATLLALFAAAGLVHIYLGHRWKSWGFMVGMLLGCICEFIGYVGRILMHDNPWSFEAFMIQIVCLTIAPVFFTASIYITLSKTIEHLAADLSRFRPSLFYWIFIPADVVCLILQAAGGALSTENDSDASDMGVDISMAGLILQVIVIGFFIIAFADYMIRYARSGRAAGFSWRLQAYFIGLVSATVLILIRCIYRVVELQDGYDGELITHETEFIILEGVVVFLAACCLCIGNPGILNHDRISGKNVDSESGLNTPERKANGDNETVLS